MKCLKGFILCVPFHDISISIKYSFGNIICEFLLGFLGSTLRILSTLKSSLITWLRCISLASLGSDTVVPAGVGVLDKASQVVE